MPTTRPDDGTFRQLLRQPRLALWALYLLLIPIYIFPSGLPQPGDMFVVILVPVVLLGWNGRLARYARDVYRPLLWFTVWVCVIDFGWAIVSGNFGFFGTDTYLLYPLYYIYNALIFLAALVLYREHGDAFLRLTVRVIRATIFLQVFVSLVFRTSSYRETLFFNNPNQLGYYALLSATLIAITHRRLKMRLMSSSLTLACCSYLALLSGSRAAAGGIAILLVFLVFANPRVIIVASIAAVGVVFVGSTLVDTFASTQERVLSSGHDNNLSFFEERAYDRIWLYKEYVVLGAGEGGLTRFEAEQMKMMEIHSSAGTILFSYGLVGVFLFLRFVWRIARGAQRRMTFMLLAPALYTIAHQGLRFTPLWVLLAVFTALKVEPGPPSPAAPKPATPKPAKAAA